nr:DUF397 domain-containing protein [Streptomyces sp. KO7888]
MTGVIHESTAGDAVALSWFKGSHSSGPDGETCVEIVHAPSAVHVRDSTNADGPTFAVGSQAWGAFVMYGAEARRFRRSAPAVRASVLYVPAVTFEYEYSWWRRDDMRQAWWGRARDPGRCSG